MYVRGYLQGSENGRVVTIDKKKGIKTESRNQYTSYALSKLSIIFFSTLAVKQNEHKCKRDPIYSEYR
jgi:hypothetical protein